MYQKDLKIRKKILISGIGGEIAQGVSRIIRENFPSCEIHGSDSEARHNGKLFADKLLKLPKFLINGNVKPTKDSLKQAALLTEFFLDKFLKKNNKKLPFYRKNILT